MFKNHSIHIIATYALLIITAPLISAGVASAQSVPGCPVGYTCTPVAGVNMGTTYSNGYYYGSGTYTGVTASPTAGQVVSPYNTNVPASGSTAAAAQIAGVPAACSFTTNLGIGSTGDDVARLQTFLNRNGYSIPATGYFGTLTSAALSRFQAAFAITQENGYLGPMTRVRIATVCGTPTTVPTATNSSGAAVSGFMVFYPNGGERLTAGQSIAISFSPYGAYGSPIEIDLVNMDTRFENQLGIVTGQAADRQTFNTVIPAGSISGNYKIRVLSHANYQIQAQDLSDSTFYVTASQAGSGVSVSSINPISGGAGTTVTVVGTNLSRASALNFYNSAGQYAGSINVLATTSQSATFVISTSFAANVPSGAYQVNVTTSDCPGGCDSNRLSFTLFGAAVSNNTFAITADIKANGSDAPASVANNSTVRISWSSTNATYCTSFGPSVSLVGGGVWTSSSRLASTGSVDVVAYTGGNMSPFNMNFGIQCYNSAGTYVTDQVALPVIISSQTTGTNTSASSATAPTTSFRLSSNSIVLGQTVTFYSITTSPSQTLRTASIDLSSDNNTWVSGGPGAQWYWSNSYTSVAQPAFTISSNYTPTAVGTYYFRSRGTDSTGASSFVYQTLTVTASATTATPPSTSSLSNTGTLNSVSVAASPSSVATGGSVSVVTNANGTGITNIGIETRAPGGSWSNAGIFNPQTVGSILKSIVLSQVGIHEFRSYASVNNGATYSYSNPASVNVYSNLSSGLCTGTEPTANSYTTKGAYLYPFNYTGQTNWNFTTGTPSYCQYTCTNGGVSNGAGCTAPASTAAAPAAPIINLVSSSVSPSSVIVGGTVTVYADVSASGTVTNEGIEQRFNRGSWQNTRILTPQNNNRQGVSLSFSQAGTYEFRTYASVNNGATYSYSSNSSLLVSASVTAYQSCGGTEPAASAYVTKGSSQYNLSYSPSTWTYTTASPGACQYTCTNSGVYSGGACTAPTGSTAATSAAAPAAIIGSVSNSASLSSILIGGTVSVSVNVSATGAVTNEGLEYRYNGGSWQNYRILTPQNNTAQTVSVTLSQSGTYEFRTYASVNNGSTYTYSPASTVTVSASPAAYQSCGGTEPAASSYVTKGLSQYNVGYTTTSWTYTTSSPNACQYTCTNSGVYSGGACTAPVAAAPVAPTISSVTVGANPTARIGEFVRINISVNTNGTVTNAGLEASVDGGSWFNAGQATPIANASAGVGVTYTQAGAYDFRAYGSIDGGATYTRSGTTRVTVTE